MFKVIIAGGRDFNDYDLLVKVCDHMLSNKINDNNIDIEIVSGNANGADKLGEKYAIERNFKLKLFPADWITYNKSAGYIRNKQMSEYADALICFWDGFSKGSKHMIDLASQKNLKIKIQNY
jgi:hypothetical protein